MYSVVLHVFVVLVHIFVSFADHMLNYSVPT